MYRIKFEVLTSVMERIAGIFWLGDFLGEFLVDMWLGTGLESTGSFFGILDQNFWAIHVIDLSNHKKTLPHLTPHTHTQE